MSQHASTQFINGQGPIRRAKKGNAVSKLLQTRADRITRGSIIDQQDDSYYG
jgi:hypothetical protein